MTTVSITATTSHGYTLYACTSCGALCVAEGVDQRKVHDFAEKHLFNTHGLFITEET